MIANFQELLGLFLNICSKYHDVTAWWLQT